MIGKHNRDRTGRTSLAVITSHPVHYKVHLYRQLTRVPGLDLTVLFCSRFGMTLTMDYTSGCTAQWYNESILGGYPHYFLHNLSWQDTPRTFWGNINPGVLTRLVRGRFDAVLLEGYALASDWLTLVAARLAGVPLLLRAETSLARPNGTRPATFAKYCAMAALRRTVSVFLPIGSDSQRFYMHHAFPEDRLVLSPYSVDNEFYEAEAVRLAPEREAFRARHHFPAGLPIILFVGKLIPRKRCMDLVRAFRPLAHSAALVVVGDGTEREQIARYVAAHRVSNVVFAGFRRPEETTLYFAVADIFAFPSGHETWGLVVNEAMCFSLPVVTTSSVGATRDLVRADENGLLYDAGDTYALTECLRLLVASPELRRRMGEASRRRIDRWTVHHSVEGILEGIEIARARRLPTSDRTPRVPSSGVEG